MIAFLLALFTGGLLVAAQTTTTTLRPIIRPQIFSFSTNYDSTTRVPSCSPIEFNYTASGFSDAVATPEGPFYAYFIADGFELLHAVSTSNATTGSMRVTTDLPVGTIFTIAMRDSNGYSGGVQGPYTTTSRTGSSCNVHQASAVGDDSLLATTSPSPHGTTCENLIGVIASGNPPFRFGLITLPPSDPAQYYGELSTGFSTFIVDVSSVVVRNDSYYFYLSDADSRTSAIHVYINGLGTSACSDNATSSSSAFASATAPGASSQSSAGNSRTSLSLPSSRPSSSSADSSSSASQSEETAGIGNGLSNEGQQQGSSKSNVGAIAGGVVAGVVALLALIALLLFLRRRKNKTQEVAPPTTFKADYPPSQYSPPLAPPPGGAPALAYAAQPYSPAPSVAPAYPSYSPPSTEPTSPPPAFIPAPTPVSAPTTNVRPVSWDDENDLSPVAGVGGFARMDDGTTHEQAHGATEDFQGGFRPQSELFVRTPEEREAMRQSQITSSSGGLPAGARPAN